MKGLAGALVGLLLLAAPARSAPLFMGLGDLPGGIFESAAIALSADGSTVVGQSASANGPREAFRWTAGGGIEGLGDLPGGRFESLALGASGDGTVVVGQSFARSDFLDGIDAFRWTREDGLVSLGSLPGGGQVSRASGISADGLIIAGDASSANVTVPFGTEAFRWTQEAGMVGLGDLPGGEFRSIAWDISADGSTIVGQGTSENGTEAFRWQETSPGTGLMLGLGDLPGGSFESVAFGTSANGSVIVGRSRSSSGTEAFRWTAANGMVGLGDLQGGDFLSVAVDASGDGSVVVGLSATGTDSNPSGFEAFIWDEIQGMRNLNEVLTNRFGLDLAGWTLAEAAGISDDGLVITGSGFNPSGQVEAWYAVIPEPSTGALVGVALVFLGSARRRRTIATLRS